MQLEKRKKRNTLIPENSSGQGKTGLVPEELDRWNWGAFLLGWIWALGNNKLDMAIYGMGVFMLSLLLGPVGWLAEILFGVVFGAMGNEWAWQSREWLTVNQFRERQKTWAKWGILALALNCLLVIYIGITGFGMWRI